MSGNPPLIELQGHLIPQLYPREVIAIRRGDIDAVIDNIPHLDERWQARGIVFLTNLRLVFVAQDQQDPTGLQAFEFPLAFTTATKFNQPIFSCNNLTGTTWTTAPQGTPDDTSPPLKWVFYFKNGGVGTFLPLYFTLQEQAAQHYREANSATASSQQHLSADIKSHVATAFVDPSDPSTLYLSQPTETDRVPTAPVYASHYGDDEEYEPL